VELGPPGRPAAVLLPVFDVAGRPHLILTKRTDSLSTHRGQVSLPGGRRDPGDPSPADTALRETEEELGIPRERIRVLGMLDDVATFVSNFIVTPVVGVLDARPVTVPNPGEIARVIEVPLDRVLAVDATLPPGAGVRELRYPLDGEDVWGATARILRGFSDLVRGALHDGGADPR
jgi:8-oxo-dGTP pyrophosphatase MutT (NUDIX family)